MHVDDTPPRRIYLDNAATTPLDRSVLDAMMPYLTRDFGNASSVHRSGQRARRAVETAREQVAEALGAKPEGVIFTSGATEADNQAVLGLMAERPAAALLTSPLEHAAVRSTALHLVDSGRRVHWLHPREGGLIAPEDVAEALDLHADLRVVALMLINNETGGRTDIRAVAEAVHARGGVLLCDAVQGLGYEAVGLDALDVDVLTVSAHKVGGPKGVGALVLRDGLDLPPLLHGGEQERGMRPGTHDTAGIVGMGEAVRSAAAGLDARRAAVRHVRDTFEAAATRVPGVRVNGSEAPRGVKHANLLVAGVDGESLLFALDELGVEASVGSACAAGSVEPSHVLLAMGLDRDQARSSVRFTFGPGTREGDALVAAKRFAQAVERCRATQA